MKTIQSQDQGEALRKVLEEIVRDIEEASLYEGSIYVERRVPPPGTPTDTLADYPSLVVLEERQTKLLGLIPYHKTRIIFIVKEGFYDMQDTGRKDILVLLISKGAEMIVRKRLQEYGRQHQVTEVVFKG